MMPPAVIEEREDLIHNAESIWTSDDKGNGGGGELKAASEYADVLEQSNGGVSHQRNSSTSTGKDGLQRGEISESCKRSNALDPRVDPFEPREGKTLLWTNVNMKLQAKKKGANGAKSEINLLTNVWGEVPNKKTTAIMGSSGAGKSSLLNILSGRQSSKGRLKIEADVRLNNYKVDPTNIKVRKAIAFVSQDDSLPVTTTPREIIRFSARLRLPRATTEEQLDAIVERMVDELGLTSCAETIVGGALIKGISGGERKRTSVGVELVVKPAMVFLDEPTSGLDAFNAVRLCNVLKKVANAGSSVMFTIHQPSSEIFEAFDQVILLHKGRIMYQGPTFEVPAFFRNCGHPVPMHHNPADWIMHVAQAVPMDQLDEDGFFSEDKRELPDPFDGKEDSKHDELGNTLNSREEASPNYEEYDAKQKEKKRMVGMGVQIKLLFKRDLIDIKRNSYALKTRFGLTIFLGLMNGSLFYNVGATDYTVPSHLTSAFGGLVSICITCILQTFLPAILQFPADRPVFLREYSTNHYSVLAYFMTKLTIETVLTSVQVFISSILTWFLIAFKCDFASFFGVCFMMSLTGCALGAMMGSVAPNLSVAIEMFPLPLAPQLIFSGLFLKAELIPKFLRWMQPLMPLTYAVRILAVGEFEFNCDSFLGIDLCSNLIIDLGACYYDIWWYWIVMVAIFILLRIMALIVLQRKATQFFG